MGVLKGHSFVGKGQIAMHEGHVAMGEGHVVAGEGWLGVVGVVGVESLLDDDLGAGPPLLSVVDQELAHLGVLLVTVVGLLVVVLPAELGDGREVEQFDPVVDRLEMPEFVHFLEHLVVVWVVVVRGMGVFVLAELPGEGAYLEGLAGEFGIFFVLFLDDFEDGPFADLDDGGVGDVGDVVGEVCLVGDHLLDVDAGEQVGGDCLGAGLGSVHPHATLLLNL